MSFQPLDPLDSAFVTLELPGAPLHIGAVLEFEADDGLTPGERFAEMKKNVVARLHEIPVLTRRVVRAPLDLVWPVSADDPTFDIDHHFVRMAVASPGGPEEFDQLVSRIMSRELVRDRPLWEINVIEGLANGRGAIVFKVHHALADGVSGASTFAGLFDISPDVRVPTPPEESIAKSIRLPSPIDLFTDTLRRVREKPKKVLGCVRSKVEFAADAVQRVARALKAHEQGIDETEQPTFLEAARTSINGAPSHVKKYSRLSIPLSEAKKAAKSRDATVTDLVLSVVSGGLRRLFEDRGEVLSRDLIAFMPINVRRPGAEGDLGNQFSAMLVRLRTDIADPEARLRAIAQNSSKAVNEHRQSGSQLLMNLAARSGPALASVAGKTISSLQLFDRLPPIANVVVSSVPGPPIPLWISGHRILSASPLGPLMAGLSLNVTVLGYGDQLDFGLLACARRVPELEQFREYLDLEAQYLLESDD